MAVVSCDFNDTFSDNPNNVLSFTTDSVKLDTLFSTVGSSTYSFWVHNNSSDGIRISSVRLRKGNQTGFRVNVDGHYLDNSRGAVVTDIDIRHGDSLRVMVALTASEGSDEVSRLVEDDLVFTLQSGIEQRVVLSCPVWDAIRIENLEVTSDTVIESQRPVVVYGKGITVHEGVTLAVRNTTLYFHHNSGLFVDGRLITDNCLMRGDRLDHMFDYLPFDRVSGQWQGIRFGETSKGNVMTDTEIRNATDALVVDSAAIDDDVLRLDMTRCVVHNAKGNGIMAVNATTRFSFCQLTNTLGHCLAIMGGRSIVDNCTLAQFYPFDADHGAALFFSNSYGDKELPLLGLQVEGSLITGYKTDVITGARRDSEIAFDYTFTSSVLRTPRVETEDSVRFIDCLWESPSDSIEGKHHFRLIDEQQLRYDFHLSEQNDKCAGFGCYPTISR